jgi:hypothetical protein
MKWEIAAAWVQAIGTIFALGIAIWLPRQEERSRRKQALLTAQRIIAKIINRLEQLEKLAKNPRKGSAMEPELTLAELAAFVERVPLGPLGTAEIQALLSMAAICRRTRDSWVKNVQPALDRGSQVPDVQLRLLHEAVGQAKRLQAGLAENPLG